MTRRYAFRVVNVFAEQRLAGNPLAVVEDAQGLSDAEMQALALQFNLSETTFLLAAGDADAHVRIFTPTFEMPFAGHPTLGSAFVVRALGRGGDAVRLKMRAGIIPVGAGADAARRDVWTLTANAPTFRAYEFSRAKVAEALGLEEADVAAEPRWCSAGVEQLIVPLTSVAAVERVRPRMDLCLEYCANFMEAQAYVFARHDAGNVVSRYFFQQGGSLIEDPGTGSACANLGAYLLDTGVTPPLRVDVHQGAATGRPCLLHLEIDADRRIRVGGRVVEIMRGEITLD
ncbi:MAG: PhzF family phenazine biosynthesis protein [Rudaea sp.]